MTIETEEKLIREVSVLLTKVMASEKLVHDVERYFEEHHEEWTPGFVSHFQDTLERKRELIDYQWHRIERMGQAIASGRSEEWWERSEFDI